MDVQRDSYALMDKGQAMCLDACFPQNWWEFTVDCATHVYNCTPVQHHNWKTSFENLKHTKPDVTHLHVFGCGAYVFLPEEVFVNKLNPESKLMIFLGYPQGTKGYLFMRGPNNMLFTATQALFNETLFPKCPYVHHSRYTPVAPPVDAQDEYNIASDDNENVDHMGADLHPAPPGRFVPYPASPPGNNQNHGPLILPGLSHSRPDSDDFHGPLVTPPPISPCGDPDSSHEFFNPNSDPDYSYTSKSFKFGDPWYLSTPTKI